MRKRYGAKEIEGDNFEIKAHTISYFRFENAQFESANHANDPVPLGHVQLRRVPDGQRRHPSRRRHWLGRKVLTELFLKRETFLASLLMLVAPPGVRFSLRRVP